VFVALADYAAAQLTELSLSRNDVIEVLNKGAGDWWFGRRADGKEVRG
jgi:uncharacterized protein YdiU (UPF0061 family)